MIRLGCEVAGIQAGAINSGGSPKAPQVPQKKLAQEMSEYPPISPDRWCLSNLGERGPVSRPVHLGYVLYLGNEA